MQGRGTGAVPVRSTMPYKDKEARKAYKRQWTAKRRQNWIDENGPCSCGSSDRLEIDHIDPELKTMDPSLIFNRNETIREKELKNCQVLCYDSLLKKTQKWYEDRRKHGTWNMYNRWQCRCEDCRQAGSNYRMKLKS